MANTLTEYLSAKIDALSDGSIAIAFSGGGDSTALLHALRHHLRVTHAFIIDHNLRAESQEETRQAASFAKSLGYITSVQTWDHTNPKTAIQVKARQYRYAAMGEMCRRTGIDYLLTAHTNDDQAETLLMRQDRQTGWRGLAGMRAKAYGPLWPALADVTLVRPLLNVSRKELRDYNQKEGLSWIDDPSNENQDFTRVRARQKLNTDPVLKTDLLSLQVEQESRLKSERQKFASWFADFAELKPEGYFELSKIPYPELLLHLLRFASGKGGPIDSARRQALCLDMQRSDFKSSTLGGAWVAKTKEGFVVTRDKVAVTGRGGKPPEILDRVLLEKDTPFIWDGRFKLRAQTDDIEVRPAFGTLEKLRQQSEFEHIFEAPASVRPSLPIFYQKGCPIRFGAGHWSDMKSESLAEKRLEQLWQIN